MSSVSNTRTNPNTANSNTSQVSQSDLQKITSKLANDVKKGDQSALQTDLLDAAKKFQSAGGDIKDFSGGIDAGLKANGVNGDDPKILPEQKAALQGLVQETQKWSAQGAVDSGNASSAGGKSSSGAASGSSNGGNFFTAT